MQFLNRDKFSLHLHETLLSTCIYVKVLMYLEKKVNNEVKNFLG